MLGVGRKPIYHSYGMKFFIKIESVILDFYCIKHFLYLYLLKRTMNYDHFLVLSKLYIYHETYKYKEEIINI